MGSCFSSFTFNPQYKTAIVITIDGSLKEHPVPVTASSVLGSDHPFFFLCSSDELYFDKFIPALDLNASLQSGQIYFVLSTERLKRRLSESDMANLAVIASVAISDASEGCGRKRRIRVMPVDEIYEEDGNERVNERKVGVRRRWLADQRGCGYAGGARMNTIVEEIDEH